MNYGFIGAGNMASSIIKGFTSSTANDTVFAFDRNREKLVKLNESYGVIPCESASEIVTKCDVVILAIKPIGFEPLLKGLSEDFRKKRPLIISIAAGISTKKITDFLGYENAVIRVMPNMNAQVLQSVSAICKNSLVDENGYQAASKLFRSIGDVIDIDEKALDVFTSIAGCSPAYVYLFIDSLAKGAQKAGMDKKTAIKIAAGAVLGSAKMVLESGEHPWELIDKVCSPGGTTIEGVVTLEKMGFQTAIVNAVDATIEKDRFIARQE